MRAGSGTADSPGAYRRRPAAYSRPAPIAIYLLSFSSSALNRAIRDYLSSSSSALICAIRSHHLFTTMPPHIPHGGRRRFGARTTL